jgi:hypothetical protein
LAKAKTKRKNNMKRHNIVRLAFGLAVSAVMLLTAAESSAQSSPSANGKCLVGTWQVLRHGVDCVTRERLNPDFPTLMTFNRGGTLNGYSVAPGDSPGLETPEYGYWTHQQGTQTYTLRDVGYNYDDTGTFAGRGEITATTTLAADGNSLTADAAVDIYDADGNLLFSFCGMWTGTRFQ